VRYDYALSDMYERDDSLLAGNAKVETETETEEN
jgi:hypothetical protein